MKRLNSIAIVSLIGIAGCVTSNKNQQPEFEAAEVLERIGGASSTPEWATGVKSTFEDSGNVIFISTVTFAGNSRPEACVRAAGDYGRAEILRQIKEAISVSGQTSEVSADSDPVTEMFIAILAQRELTGIKINERYWEKKVESDESGQRVLKIHCAAKVAINKSLLNKQIQSAIAGADVNKEQREKLREKQMQFFENLSAEAH